MLYPIDYRGQGGFRLQARDGSAKLAVKAVECGEMGDEMTRQATMWMILLALAAGLAPASAAPRYSIKRTGDVVQLRDGTSDTVVSVLLPVNNAYEMVVKGRNVIRMTINSVDQLRANPGLNGIPFLAPFANRLDEDAFYANGKKYNFDMELGNVRGAVPIHGYLSGTSRWQLVAAKADGKSAWVTSKLEFSKYPDYMKQFPFAHTITMTYRLANGAMEVHTRLDNQSAEPMPVAIGFHPYFALTDSVRKDWTLSAPLKKHWLLTDTKVPTGQTEPAENFFGGDPHAVPLSRFADKPIDDVFSDIERDAKGRGTITFKGASQSISLTAGPNFKGFVLFSTVPMPPNAGRGGAGRGPAAAPPPPVSVGPAIPLSAADTGPAPFERGFMAIEPYASITDCMNLAQKGLCSDLASIQPGGHWEESFWVTPSGY
jgi:aldose 1-epimerase